MSPSANEPAVVPEVPTLTPEEVQQIEAALAAARAGRERGWFDPATGALAGTRPVVDGAAQLASVTAIRRHGR
jgi:hypothetical protein